MAQPLLLPVSRVQLRQWTFLQTELPTRQKHADTQNNPSAGQSEEVRGEVRVVLTVAVAKTDGETAFCRLTESLREGGLRDALRVGTGVTTVEVRTAAVFKRSRCTWRCRRSRGAGAATTAFWMPTRVTWTAAGAAARSAGTTKSATATRTAMRSTPAWRMCAPPPVEARRECLRVARRTLLTSVITLALIVCVMATIVSVLFVVRKDREKVSLVENCGVYGVWTKQDTPYYYKPNTA